MYIYEEYLKPQLLDLYVIEYRMVNTEWRVYNTCSYNTLYIVYV